MNSRFSAAEFFAASAAPQPRRSTLISGRLLIELTRGNRVLAPQFLRAIQFDLRKLELRLHALDFGRGAIEVRLVRARIDHVKQVALFDDRAGLEMDLGNVAGHARPNLDRFDRPPAAR